MNPSVKLNVVVYADGAEWVAHCLQMDLVTTGATMEAVQDDIVDLIKAQVVYAYENDNMESIFRPAPASEWARLSDALSCFSRVLTIDLPPRQLKLLPIREVELCQVA